MYVRVLVSAGGTVVVLDGLFKSNKGLYSSRNNRVYLEKRTYSLHTLIGGQNMARIIPRGGGLAWHLHFEENKTEEGRRGDRTGQEESKPKDDCNGQHWLDYDTFGNSQVCTTGWML